MSALDAIRDRLRRGERVTPADLHTAETAERLAVLEAEVHTEAEAEAAEAARRAQVATLLDQFARAADTVNARINTAGNAFEAAYAELWAAHEAVNVTTRHYLDDLRRHGWHADYSNVEDRTDGRVVLNRDYFGGVHTIKVPRWRDYIANVNSAKERQR